MSLTPEQQELFKKTIEAVDETTDKMISTKNKILDNLFDVKHINKATLTDMDSILIKMNKAIEIVAEIEKSLVEHLNEKNKKDTQC